ncbi:MAG: NAD(P)H-dependent oxidoreductase [Patescibacteria group bacterium]|nr:NAD(P)H-dependent oxidoreductase [Patescibacteria group bacterium]
MKVQIIVGSTRPGRATLNVAKWVAAEAATIEGAEVQIVDLKDFGLPFFDEAISPRYNPDRQPTAAVQQWLDTVATADAYVFVTPEYNHSISGVLKNAIDFLTYELKQKPVAVVSHGGVGGARAATHLKEILSEAAATMIPSGVQFVGYVNQGSLIDEDGKLDAAIKANPYGPQGAITGMLADLKWHSDALAAAR